MNHSFMGKRFIVSKPYGVLNKGDIVYYEKSIDSYNVMVSHKRKDGHTFNGQQKIPFNYLEQPMIKTKDIPAIRAGNIVELSDGMRGLVIATPNGRLYVYWCDKPSKGDILGVFRNGATVDNVLKQAIHKVYQGVTDERPYAGNGNRIYSYQDIIWEKDLTTEITLEQIAEKFGVDVKNIKIKGYE